MKKTNSFVKKITSLFLSLVFVLTSFAAVDFSKTAAIEAKADSEEYYLMGYFTGNGSAVSSTSGNQANRFAISDDGIKFSALNNNKPLITQTKGTLNARDPYLFVGQDGYYYMICTDQDYSDGNWGKLCSTFVIWRSADLLNWTDETIIDIHNVAGCATSVINYAWAPQVAWDSAANKYMVYFAFKDDQHTVANYGYNCQMMYYCYATNLLDVSTWETPRCLYDNSSASIDGDITEENGKFYMFYKDESKATVCLATSNAMNGPYSFVGKIDSSSTTGGIEGCQVYKVGSDYYLVADRYGAAGRFVIYNLGDNLADVAAAEDNGVIPVNNGNPVSTVEETDGFSNLQARHGSVIHISKAQYNALKKAYNGSTPDDITFAFDKSYTAENAWHYDNIDDASGYKFDMMTKSGGYSYVIPQSNYLSLNGAVAFSNDSHIKDIFNQGNSWTVAFNVNTVQSRGSTLFALCSGDAPASSIDWVRFLDNGKLVLYYDGAYHEVGSTDITTTVEYRFTLSYDGSKIVLYKNGKEAVSHSIASIPYDKTKSTSPVCFGWTDTIGVTAVNAAYSKVRIRNRAITAAEAANEYSMDSYMAYQYNEGTETVDGRSNVTYSGGGFGTTYSGKRGASFAVASWVNIGANKNTGLLDSARAMLFEFGSGGTGDGKNYLGMTEDGKFRFCWSEGSTARYVDVNDVYTFEVNTWYYLQINIIPDGDQWHIQIFVNGVSAKNVTSGYNNMRSYDYSPINMLSQESFPLYFGIGHAYWTTAGYNLIDDFRVYNSAVDPAALYDSIQIEDISSVARDYVRANLESYDVNASENKANRAAYHYTNVATNGYNNVLASSYNDTVHRGVNAQNNIYYDFYWPNNIALMYDGVNTPSLPVTAVSQVNARNTTRTLQTIFVNQSSNSNFHNAHYWTGYVDSDNTKWPGDSNPYNYDDGIINQNGKLSGATYIGYGDGAQYDYTYSFNNRNTPRYFWNKLNYTGSCNTTDYYEHYTSIPYRSWDGAARDITDVNHNIYIVNYKPIYDILKDGSTVYVPKRGDDISLNLKNFYTYIVKDNEDNWTEDSLNQFYIAAYKVLTCNPVEYTEEQYRSNFSSTVTQAAAEIKSAVEAFNNIKLDPRASYTALDSAYNSALDTIATLGTNSQTNTTTSINALSDAISGLTYEPNDGRINRANLSAELYQDDINSETAEINSAITALDLRADVSGLNTSFNTSDTLLKGLAGEDAVYTKDSIDNLISAVTASGISTYIGDVDTTDMGQRANQSAINTYKSNIDSAYSALETVAFSSEAVTEYKEVYQKLDVVDPDAYEENQAGSMGTAKRAAEALFDESTYGDETIKVVRDGIDSGDLEYSITTMLSALTTCVKRYDVVADGGVAEITANDGEYKEGKATYGTKLTFRASDPETVWYLDVNSETVHKNSAFQGFGEKLEVKTVGEITVSTKTRGTGESRVKIVREYSNSSFSPVQLVDFVDDSFGLPAAPAIAYYNFSGYYLKGRDERLDNPSASYPQNISISADTEIVAKYTYNGEASCAVNATTLEGGSVSKPDAVAYNSRIDLEGGEGAYGWSVDLGNGNYRPFYVGADLTMYATDSMNLVAENETTFKAHGYSLPAIFLRESGAVASGTKTIFNAQVVAEDIEAVKECGILVAVGNGKQPGSSEPVTPVVPSDSQIIVENSGQQTGFAVLRAKSTKFVGANQISIAVNNLPSGYAYRGYLIYDDGTSLKTVYTDVIR